ncbi:hypothetical protein [Pelagibius sp. 7325]|uniref:hypothetical protein n=1 Tax=Pelagibius sp. 7325 TaxID=3131994 RepID=UPI0030EE12C7
MDRPGYDDEASKAALAALGALIESGVLGEGSRLRPLLRYLVIEELEGRGDRLKAYTIATDVFGRGDDFDPNTDSIVRVEVHRLRQALDHYYATQGAGERVAIAIPKGSYRPAITVSDAAPAAAPAAASAASPTRPATRRRTATLAVGVALLLLAALGAWAFSGWPVSLRQPQTPEPQPLFALEVLPFGAVSDGTTPHDLAVSLTDEVITGLSRIRALTVVVRDPAITQRMDAGLPQQQEDPGIAYFMRGSVQRFGGATRVVIQLIEARSGKLLWAQAYQGAGEEREMTIDPMVSTIVSELRQQVFDAAKQALETADTDSLNAWQLYLQATRVPGAATSSLAWEKERIALAERALALRPDFGQAHAILADKLAFLASVDPPSDTAALRRRAVFHAQQALELAPEDADVLFNVSLYYWHLGRLQQSAEAIHRTLELDPNHALARMLDDTLPFTCAAPPQETLQRAVIYDGALSPDNPIRWMTLNWIATLYMNNGNFLRSAEVGRRSRLIFSSPDSTLRDAAVLLRLGRADEAVALVDGLRRHWPDLDPRHYARITIPRRCHGEPGAGLLGQLFNDLAAVVEAGS